MKASNETVEDIVQEMRDYGTTPPPRRAWIDLANRIEFAHNRKVDLNLRAIKTWVDTSNSLRDKLCEDESELNRLHSKLELAETALKKCMASMCESCVLAPAINGSSCIRGCETFTMVKEVLAAIQGDGRFNGN